MKLLRKVKHDEELERISKKMEEIKSSNRDAVKELEKLNRTMQDMAKRLRYVTKG